MVQFGNLQVMVVEAESKTPFKEHTNEVDAKQYVEVEPEAEYFITTRKTGQSEKPLVLGFEVDGTPLNYSCYYSSNFCSTQDDIDYHGMFVRNHDGTTTDRALKFVIPPSLEGEQDSELPQFFGTIKMRVHEAVVASSRVADDACPHSLSGGTTRKLSPEQVTIPKGKGGLKEKVIRSAEGEYSITSTSVSARERNFDWSSGEFLGELTLHCCTAMGLLKAGILSAAHQWEFLRKSKPADPLYELNVDFRKMKYEGAEDGLPKEAELFDLSVLPDDYEVLKPKFWSTKRQPKKQKLLAVTPDKSLEGH